MLDAINDNGTITTECEDITVDDEVNLTLTFEGAGPLSGAEDTALDALIASFTCEGYLNVDEGAGLTIQQNRISFVGDTENINFEGAVASATDNLIPALGGPELSNRANVLIGSLRMKNPNLYAIPNNTPVYPVAYCIQCNAVEVDIADASDVNKMPAMGVTQFGDMVAALPIVGVQIGSPGNGHFVVNGDHTARFVSGETFAISLSTGNNAGYITLSSSYASGPDETTIIPREEVVDATVDGRIADFGFVAISGETRKCDTSGTTINGPIYVADGGGVTTTKPNGPSKVQVMGRATYISATEGRVLIFGIGRFNDIPNLTEDHIWIGDENNQPEEVPFDDLQGPTGLGKWHDLKVFGDDSGIGDKFLHALGHHMESNKNSVPMLSSGKIIHVSISVNGKTVYPTKDATIQLVKNAVEGGSGVLSGGTQIGTDLDKNNNQRVQLFTNLTGFTFAQGDVISCYLKKNPDDLKAPYVTIYIRYD